MDDTKLSMQSEEKIHKFDFKDISNEIKFQYKQNQ